MKLLIVLPTYNEENILRPNTLRVLEWLQTNYPADEYSILIADNGSTDHSPEIARGLAQQYPQIRYFHLPEGGRGRALKKAWQETAADIYCYMDVDLAVDLKYLKALINPLIKQEADIVIGSRYAAGAQVDRSLNRAIISKVYNWLLRLTLGVNFKDAQCGFKAINNQIKQQVLPRTNNTNWFFDTELLVLAERQNWRIKEIGVQWREPRLRHSKVKIIATSYEYLHEISRFKRRH